MMTVPELLHHEDLFVGTLGVRLGAAGTFSLVTQGLDYPANGVCPARSKDGLCSLHTNRKPAMCSTVPLDPFQSDATQHIVLHQRNSGVGYIGADCIAPGLREDMPLLVANGAVVEPAYRQQLHSHRQLLNEEQALWAESVTHMLRGQVPAQPPAQPPGAAGGMLTLPLVPVLSVLAAWSEACRERCLRYVQHQRALLLQQINQALKRKREQDRPLTTEFRHYAAAYTRLAELLSKGGAQRQASSTEVARAEAYLGV